MDRARIAELIKENKPLLVHWNAILHTCLADKEPKKFIRLKSVADFIDGLLVVVPKGIKTQQVQRIFRDHGLDVMPPRMQKKSGNFWVQLASGPYDLEHNIPILMQIAEEIRELQLVDLGIVYQPVVVKLDSTRDLGGSFYAAGNWKEKHRELN